MKTRNIAIVVASALLTVGLIPFASAEAAPRAVPEGIEVITVVGNRAMPEGIEVITVVGNEPMPEGIEVVTVVGKRADPAVASACVNEVFAARDIAAPRTRDVVRQAIRTCIEQARLTATHS